MALHILSCKTGGGKMKHLTTAIYTQPNAHPNLKVHSRKKKGFIVGILYWVLILLGNLLEVQNSIIWPACYYTIDKPGRYAAAWVCCYFICNLGIIFNFL